MTISKLLYIHVSRLKDQLKIEDRNQIFTYILIYITFSKNVYVISTLRTNLFHKQ